MAERSGSLRGDLIKWAREEQRLTMRWVADNGGPCLGYQSEVENKKKAEVRWDKLTPWIKALNVTEPFVRGNVPRFRDDPAACRGLAADVGESIVTHRIGPADWGALTPMERTRQVLCLISRESRNLPRVVLAHVLSLELDTLDALMEGSVSIAPYIATELVQLTTLPDGFFRYGISEPAQEQVSEAPAEYGTLLQALSEAGVTPEELATLLAYRDAVHLASANRITPELLMRLIRSHMS